MCKGEEKEGQGESCKDFRGQNQYSMAEGKRGVHVGADLDLPELAQAPFFVFQPPPRILPEILQNSAFTPPAVAMVMKNLDSVKSSLCSWQRGCSTLPPACLPACSWAASYDCFQNSGPVHLSVETQHCPPRAQGGSQGSLENIEPNPS